MKFYDWTRYFAVRLVVAVAGAGLAGLGWYAWSHEIYWVTVFNPRLGQFGFLPTLILVFLGAVIILGAIFFPNEKGLTSKEEERHERKHQKWIKRDKYMKHYPPD